MTIAALHKLFLRHQQIATDTRKITENCIFFALKGANFNGNTFADEALNKGAAYVVIDEKKYQTSSHHILVENVLTTLQNLATYHRKYTKVKVIALTGSNGKTTTKELINTVLSKKYRTIATKGNFNNHIGVPLTLLSIQENTEIAIVEMGANHQKEIAFLSSIAQPDYGYITNFGKAHIEGFGSEEGVIKGKSELYDYLIANNKSIFLNADDPIQVKILGSYINKFGFSQKNTQYYTIEFIEANPFVHIKVEDYKINTQLIGSYNFTNCAAAIVIGKYFNVALKEIKSAIESYIPENNRSQIVYKNNHQIILDAYNANPSSMKVALENFSDMDAKNKVVILGDMFELGPIAMHEHNAIVKMANDFNFDSVFFIGENFKQSCTNENSFEFFEDFKKYINTHSLPENATILIKGSRGMALERIIELL